LPGGRGREQRAKRLIMRFYTTFSGNYHSRKVNSIVWELDIWDFVLPFFFLSIWLWPCEILSCSLFYIHQRINENIYVCVCIYEYSCYEILHYLLCLAQWREIYKLWILDTLC
jgi:hypothetical protein